MGGSGGGGYYLGAAPKELKADARQAIDDLATEFRPTLQKHLNNLLPVINDHDGEKINKKRDEIIQLVADQLETTVSLPLAGSVQKNTYVNGISDVDTLLVLKAEVGAESLPDELAIKVANELQKKLPDAKLSVGTLAITVDYSDGTEIQLIPTVKDGDTVKIRDWNNNEWSRIQPDFLRGN